MDITDYAVLQKSLYINFTEIFFVCVTSWFLAQFLKFSGTCIVRKKVHPGVFFETGGMPSAHTAMVVSFSVSILSIFGYNSFPFAMSVVFAVVVMHDAFKVRKAVGNNTLTFKHFFQDVIEQNYHKKIDELELMEQTILKGSREKKRPAHLLREIKKKQKEIEDLRQLDIVLGHTVFQVFGGALLGTIVALTYYMILR